MNVISVAGQLGRDAEMRYLSSGEPVLAFSVADSQGKDKPTIWWAASLFGKRAESLAQYLVKGQYVTVSGAVTMREYTAQDGQKKTAYDIRVNEIALQGGQKQQAQSEPAPQPKKKPIAARPAPNFSDMDDDIPFN